MATTAPTTENLKTRILKQQSGLNAAERAVMMEDTRRLLAKEDAVADAHHRKYMGDDYQPPKEEDMGDIHVGDTIYYGKPEAEKPMPVAPVQATPTEPTVPPKEKSGMSTAAKIAAMGMAAAAGGSGVGLPIAWAISQMERPAAMQDTDTDTQYDLRLFKDGTDK